MAQITTIFKKILQTFSFALSACGGVESGDVRALGRDLKLAVAEKRIGQERGVVDRRLFREFHIRETLGVAGPLVNEDGDAVDIATGFEVLLELLRGGGVVDVANINRSLVNLKIYKIQNLIKMF